MSIVRPKYVQTLVRDPEYWSRPGHRARDAYIILKCIFFFYCYYYYYYYYY